MHARIYTCMCGERESQGACAKEGGRDGEMEKGMDRERERGKEGGGEGERGVTGRKRGDTRAFVGLIVSPSFPNEVVPPRFTCV
jgi:hypothetical protein